MTESLTAAQRLSDPVTLAESAVEGPVPKFEVSDWRRRFRVVAGITGRGSQPTAFDLGLWSRTPVASTMDRWRAFRTAHQGFEASVLGMQVHGTRVQWHGDPGGWLLLEGVDGHATDRAAVLLTVTVADCVPVYLVDPAGRRIALLHAGWRGTAAGMLRAGVQLLTARGSAAEDLLMHCGVAICGRCYEVGSEVFAACGLPQPPNGDRGLLDLRAVLTAQGRELGIRHLSTSSFCSAHDADRFFSHRASGGADGRMVAYLGMLP
jgi:YfiH family protein